MNRAKISQQTLERRVRQHPPFSYLKCFIMVKKDINQTLVLAVHQHGKQRLLYLPKKISKIIPKTASLIEVDVKKVIA